MPLNKRPALVFLLLIITQFHFADAHWSAHFTKFLPEYNNAFQRILHENCSTQYAQYLANTEDKHNVTNIGPLFLDFHMDTVTHLVVECLLEVTPEYAKSKMASAQVLLGLTPTILATLGPAPQETGILAVIARRPLLAIFLATGSPAVFAYRSFEYTRAITDLHERHIKRPHFLSRGDHAIMLSEFFVATVSIANIVELAWQLGAEVIFTLLPNAQYSTALWAFLGLTIHIFGTFALSLRTDVASKPTVEEGKRRSRLLDLIKNPLRLLARRGTVRVTIRPESWYFFLVSWITSIVTAGHIIFGTLLFSSTVFVSVNDALIIIARLMASVITCRIILTYELAVLREAVEVEHEQRD